MFSSARAWFLAVGLCAFNNILATQVPAARPQKEEAPVMPPPVAPVHVEVLRGGRVEIPLRIYGPPQAVEFRIQARPRCGRLGPVRPKERGRATVLYTHGGGTDEHADRFTYASKGPLGVSAEAPVVIRIVDAPGRFSAPAEIDFGEVVAGARTVRELEISNHGGGFVEGDAQVEPPWRLAGDAHYRLGPGQTQRLQLVFEPSDEGRLQRFVRFTSEKACVTVLRGTVVAPIAVEPDPLILTPTGQGTTRAGTVTLRNRSTQVQKVELDWGPAASGPVMVELQPFAEHRIAARCDHPDPGSLDSRLLVQTGHSSRWVALRISPLPGQLEVKPETITLQPDAAADNQGKARFTVCNRGGTPLRTTVSAPAPLALEAATTDFMLDPGASRQIEVSAPIFQSGADLCVTVSADQQTRVVRIKSPARERRLSSPTPTEMPASPPVDRPVADVTPPFNQGQTGLLPPSLFSITNLTRHGAEISWPESQPGIVEYRIEKRGFYLDAEKGLETTWAPVNGLTVVRNNRSARLILENLPAGTQLGYRIIAIGEDGTESAPSRPVIFTTPPAETRHPRLVHWLWVLLALLVGARLMQRHRARRQHP